jgi:hypothetical protein
MSSLLLKWTTLLAIASAVVMAALGIISQFFPPIQTRIEWYISILLLVVAAMLSYLYGRMEILENRAKLIIDKLGLQTLEVFKTRDEFFNRALEVTIGSQIVNTQMFSDPPIEIGGQMENYFRKVAAYTRKNPKVIFRRIATLGDARKVKWLMELIFNMVGTQNFSLAYIDIDHTKTPLLCLHIVEKEKEFYTFVFHTVPASGNVCAFLIRSSEIGRVALDYFNALWERSPKLMQGKQINKNVIAELAKRYIIEDSKQFLLLDDKLKKYKY